MFDGSWGSLSDHLLLPGLRGALGGGMYMNRGCKDIGVVHVNEGGKLKSWKKIGKEKVNN